MPFSIGRLAVLSLETTAAAITFGCTDISEQADPNSTNSALSIAIEKAFKLAMKKITLSSSSNDTTTHDGDFEHSGMHSSVTAPPDDGDTFRRHMREMRAMPVDDAQSWGPVSAFNVSTNFHLGLCRGLQYSINERARELFLSYEHGSNTVNRMRNATAFCAMAVEIPAEDEMLLTYFLRQTCTVKNYVAIETKSNQTTWDVWTGCESRRLYGVSRPTRAMTVVIALSDFTVTHKMALKIQSLPLTVRHTLLTLWFETPATGKLIRLHNAVHC